ncbi:MAG: hypothetical protein R2877_07955 [Bdellovibrionota bacterium]
MQNSQFFRYKATHYGLILLLIVTVVLTSIALINYHVDLNHRWRGSFYRDVKQSWSENEIFLVPNYNFDERAFLAGISMIVPPYDVLVLGSSRMFLVNSEMLRQHALFNAAASTSVIQDYVSTWQMIKNNNRIPKYIILGIDPWAFNINSGMKTWKSNAHLYEQFITGERKEIHFRSPAKINYQRLFSGSDFLRSLAWIRGKGYRLGVSPVIDFPIHLHGYRNDGGHLYSPEFMKITSLREIEAKSRAYVSKCTNMLLCDWKLDQEAYNQLVRMLKDIKNHNVEVLLILPPYQHEALGLIRQNPSYLTIIRAYQKLVQDKLLKDTGHFTKLCDAIDPVKLGCDRTEFVDGVHSRKECVEKMIQYCLSLTGFLQP